ncbi:MAG: hypothetical protein ACQESP_06470 [Candidatus Muiribacteriota bacterium]
MSEKINNYNAILNNLKKVFTEQNIASVIVWGEDMFNPANASITVVLYNLELTFIEEAGKFLKAFDVVFLSQKDFYYSTDVFPLEYYAMKSNSRVIFGQDLLSEVKIENSNYRHQLEYELRSKAQIIQRVLFSEGARRANMVNILKEMKTSISFLIKHCANLISDDKNIFLPFYENIELLEKEFDIEMNAIKKLKNYKIKFFNFIKNYEIISSLYYEIKELADKLDKYEA